VRIKEDVSSLGMLQDSALPEARGISSRFWS